MNRLLIIRFSAIGDVAMLVPVVCSLATQYPELDITVLTRRNYTPIFDWMPRNVRLMGIDLKEYEGWRLERLFSELKTMQFDAVADMHDVIRTKYLRMRFRMAGVKTAVVDKGRDEKKQLLGHGIGHSPLKHTTERYAEVLRQLGLPLTLDYNVKGVTKNAAFLSARKITVPIFKSTGEKWVGIAPFAAHEGKIYPLEKMRQVVTELSDIGVRVFLFGAGEKESKILSSWQKNGRIVSICGKMGSLHNELVLMSQLDVMIAMDSSNMHMAAMMGTPVISVWGATHPKAGFTPWNQPEENIIQMENLPCRPCSVYGNKPCRYGDYRCMKKIQPEQIVGLVENIISGASS